MSLDEDRESDQEHLSHEEHLRKMSFLSLKNRRLQGDFTSAFKYLKKTYKKAGEGHFTRALIGQEECLETEGGLV